MPSKSMSKRIQALKSKPKSKKKSTPKKLGLVSINVVLDRSGSMGAIRDDVIGGFNQFLKDQKKEPGRAVLTLAQFDNQYEVVHDYVPLSKVPELTTKTYMPRASTALLDAVGRTVNALDKKLVGMKKRDKPEKVLFLVMTDGMENASHEFTKEQVAKLVADHQKNDKWEFVFIGANVDTFAEAQDLGMRAAGHSLSFEATSKGTADAYQVMSQCVSGYRGQPKGVVPDFFDGGGAQKKKNRSTSGGA